MSGLTRPVVSENAFLIKKIFKGFFFFFAIFIRIGQYLDRKQSGRKRGGGAWAGKVHEPGPF